MSNNNPYSNNPMSSASMVVSPIVQDPYGTGMPDFMAGGSFPSSFTRSGLQGAAPSAPMAAPLEAFDPEVAAVDPGMAASIVLGYRSGLKVPDLSYRFNIPEAVIARLILRIGDMPIAAPGSNSPGGKGYFSDMMNRGHPSWIAPEDINSSRMISGLGFSDIMEKAKENVGLTFAVGVVSGYLLCRLMNH